MTYELYLAMINSYEVGVEGNGASDNIKGYFYHNPQRSLTMSELKDMYRFFKEMKDKKRCRKIKQLILKKYLFRVMCFKPYEV